MKQNLLSVCYEYKISYSRDLYQFYKKTDSSQEAIIWHFPGRGTNELNDISSSQVDDRFSWIWTGLQKICGYHNNSHGKTSHLFAAVSVSTTDLLKNKHIAKTKKRFIKAWIYYIKENYLHIQIMGIITTKSLHIRNHSQAFLICADEALYLSLLNPRTM